MQSFPKAPSWGQLLVTHISKVGHRVPGLDSYRCNKNCSNVLCFVVSSAVMFDSFVRTHLLAGQGISGNFSRTPTFWCPTEDAPP